MVYKEIPINLLDPSPFQTRKDYDADALTGLATSSMDNIGIRYAPLIRPSMEKEGRYQIASGHARVDAWRTLGNETIICRIEKLTDSQMKKEILVENINRSDLNETERFDAIEQFRKDPTTDDEEVKRILLNKEHGFIAKLNRETGVPETTLSNIYDVQKIRFMLKSYAYDFEEEPVAFVIRGTRGLPDEERVSLVVKAVSMGWSGRTVLQVKTALKTMEPEVRALLLDKKIRLPHKVIVAVGEFEDAETQKYMIKYIQTHKYNEELALKFIDRVKKGELITEVEVVDEVEEVLKEINRVYDTVKGWGVNQYMILGQSRWADVTEIFNKIKEKMIELTVTVYE